MASYCASRSSSQGFYCILLKGHEGHCLSLDNRELWKGTPGKPVLWELRSQGPSVQSLSPRLDSTDLGAPEQTDESAGIARSKGFVGELCGNCGGFNTLRRGACILCSDCGDTSGGCS